MTTHNNPIPIFVDSQSGPRPRLHVPPEPWYYRWIESLAKLLFGLCVVLIVVAIIVGVVGALLVLGGQAGDPLARVIAAALTAIVPLVLTAFSLIGTLIVSLLLRLAVDIARNVRSLRYA
ncbi:hypothetical protein P12x_000757 [Tundrisphaera lichenicola]|uniref:hypothetical protein n=1 Tax=Tundrisphaera lichenicola TaxID=2029860 RepID=UPI003EB78325